MAKIGKFWQLQWQSSINILLTPQYQQQMTQFINLRAALSVELCGTHEKSYYLTDFSQSKSRFWYRKRSALPYGIIYTNPFIPLSITQHVNGCKVKFVNGSTIRDSKRLPTLQLGHKSHLQVSKSSLSLVFCQGLNILHQILELEEAQFFQTWFRIFNIFLKCTHGVI